MHRTALITTALAAGALIVPGAAQAHVETAVSSVKAHTSRADAALDRAVSLYDRHAAGRADRSFVVSRREMAAAKREAAKLRRQADTPREELQAARAQALVAVEQDQNIEKLTEALDGAKGRSERKVAAAALADTRGREKSLAVLTALLDEVPQQAREGIARAIAARSQGRDEEIADQAQALADRDVSSTSKRTVARSVQANVEGQAKGAERLAALIAGDDVPEEGKAGLRTAYEAVSAEHGSVADILSRFSERMPAQIRSFVEEIVTQARQDAQSMRDNRPTPPSGQPEGTPTGQPEGTPTGQPAGTPTR
ncbi:MAG TPA: PT domain-containing protein [Solirubrobacteraceae bacterium]|nr:PT domain-containing protein [Solirubrobacteraceae bacterium]